MFRALTVAFALATLTAPALAQPTPPAAATRPAMPDVAAQKAAIAKLDWMAGAWEGSGWIDMAGTRHTFRQTEQVEKRLGDGIMIVEGKGYSGTPETLAFNAFAVISFDDRTGKYRFRSYTRGFVTDAEAEFRPNGAFVWTMTPPGATIRYTITQPQPGKWNEIGERSTDAGATWTKFFEMNLTKKP